MLLRGWKRTCERSKFRWPKWSWASKNRATTLGGNCIGLTPNDRDGDDETVLAVSKRDGNWSQQLPFWTATRFCAFVFDSISCDEVKTLQIFRKFGMPGAKKKQMAMFSTLLPGTTFSKIQLESTWWVESQTISRNCLEKGDDQTHVTWTGDVASQVQIEMRCNRLLAQATATCFEPNGGNFGAALQS